MVITKDTLVVAGDPDVLKEGDELASFKGRLGGKLRLVDPNNGKTLQEIDLTSPPVFDGMIAANGQVFMSLMNGSVICLSGK